MKNLILAASLAIAAGTAIPAAAATIFSFDADASSINVTPVREGCIGRRPSPAGCTLTAGFGAGAAGYAFSPGAVGDSDRIADFIDGGVSRIPGVASISTGPVQA